MGKWERKDYPSATKPKLFGSPNWLPVRDGVLQFSVICAASYTTIAQTPTRPRIKYIQGIFLDIIYY